MRSRPILRSIATAAALTLEAEALTTSHVDLTWSEPGDDGYYGRAVDAWCDYEDNSCGTLDILGSQTRVVLDEGTLELDAERVGQHTPLQTGFRVSHLSR